MSDDEPERFCLCRSTDTGRFMIACDHCEDWFHGDCVQVRKSQAKNIRKFYCPPCRDVNPGLVIKFRPTEAGREEKKKLKKEPKEERREPRREPPKTPGAPEGLRPPGCGQCIGCFRSEDCGRCETCKARAAAAKEGTHVNPNESFNIQYLQNVPH